MQLYDGRKHKATVTAWCSTNSDNRPMESVQVTTTGTRLYMHICPPNDLSVKQRGIWFKLAETMCECYLELVRVCTGVCG